MQAHIDDTDFRQKHARPILIEIGALVAMTFGLFFFASYYDLHEMAHAIIGDPSHNTVVGQMRSIAGPSAAGLQRGSVWGVDVDDLMTLGLFASVSLTIFAFQQSGRLRAALASQREAEKRTLALALHDQLTGLANRRKFEDFGRTLIENKPAGELRAVLLIDLDHFKPVNDIHGHAAGDLVLVEFARRIGEAFPGGIAARFGGDEFAVITPVLGAADEALSHARHCIAAIAEPFFYRGIPLHLGVSVGVALMGDAEDSIGEALRRADIALYKAKNGGRNQAAFFEDSLESVVREKNWLEGALRDAIAEDRIVPHFQPIVELGSSAVLGYEALARWDHAERGPINPSDFIPVAEECGLIGQLGEQMLRKASRIACDWPVHMTLSVNLSPAQFRDKQLGRAEAPRHPGRDRISAATARGRDHRECAGQGSRNRPADDPPAAGRRHIHRA